MAQSKTAKARVKAAELRAKCMKFRSLGLTFQEIANRLGTSKTNVHKHVKIALDELSKETEGYAENYKALQLDRLEHLYFKLQIKVDKGDTTAIGQATRVLDSISKLMGADAPTKIAPTTPDGQSQYDPMEMTAEERGLRIAELEKKMGKK